MDIFVSNLPFKLKGEELKALFEPFGEVASAKIVLDHKLRQSKGYGFVNMPNFKEAKEAMKKLKGHVINQRELILSPSSEKGKIPKQGETDANRKPFWKRKIQKSKPIVSFDGAPKKPQKGKHKKRRGHGRGTTY